MTNQLETAKEWLADLNKIIDITDNECTKEKRDVLEWLVESVQELEGRKYRQDLIDEHIERLEQQNQRLKQALEYYAGEDNYEFETIVSDCDIEVKSEMLEDGGERARKALECEG